MKKEFRKGDRYQWTNAAARSLWDTVEVVDDTHVLVVSGHQMGLLKSISYLTEYWDQWTHLGKSHNFNNLYEKLRG